MPFPPNYNQERNSRSRVKAQKALEKQLKRDEKSSQRKQERPPEQGDEAVAANKKENG